MSTSPSVSRRRRKRRQYPPVLPHRRPLLNQWTDASASANAREPHAPCLVDPAQNRRPSVLPMPAGRRVGLLAPLFRAGRASSRAVVNELGALGPDTRNHSIATRLSGVLRVSCASGNSPVRHILESCRRGPRRCPAALRARGVVRRIVSTVPSVPIVRAAFDTLARETDYHPESRAGPPLPNVLAIWMFSIDQPSGVCRTNR
jgi:hypothetical protein